MVDRPSRKGQELVRSGAVETQVVLAVLDPRVGRDLAMLTRPHANPNAATLQPGSFHESL
jgi:hypothetical protein